MTNRTTTQATATVTPASMTPTIWAVNRRLQRSPCCTDKINNITITALPTLPGCDVHDLQETPGREYDRLNGRFVGPNQGLVHTVLNLNYIIHFLPKNTQVVDPEPKYPTTWTEKGKQVAGAYVLVSGGNKNMQIKTGWDNTDDTIEIPKKASPPHVASSAFKPLTCGGSKSFVYPPDLRKLDTFIIASDYLEAVGAKRKKTGDKGGTKKKTKR